MLWKRTLSYFHRLTISRLYRARYTMFGTPQIPIYTQTPIGTFELEVSPQWHRLGYTASGHNPYEPTLMQRLYEILRAEDVFYNIGSRWGIFSVFAANCDLSPNNIHDFESIKSNVDILRRNVPNDSPITVACVGETADNGQVAIDEYCERHDEPTVAKIDVEGAEAGVLRGMTNVLDQVSPHLFIEMHPNYLEIKGDDQHEVVDVLREHGYDISVYLQHRDKGESHSLEEATLPERGEYLLEAQ